MSRELALSDARERLIYAYVGQGADEISAAKAALKEAQETEDAEPQLQRAIGAAWAAGYRAGRNDAQQDARKQEEK